jgi:protein SCO1
MRSTRSSKLTISTLLIVGVEKRLSQWRGKVVLFFFGFTHCPNICPTTLMNLREAYDTLGPADRDQVRIAFISVDPRRDTPAQLKEYLSYFDPAFVGLTGSKEEIDRATGASGGSYAFVHKPGDPPYEYNVMHSANIYLINPKGEWELIYNVQQLQQPAKVAADIESILHERPTNDRRKGDYEPLGAGTRTSYRPSTRVRKITRVLATFRKDVWVDPLLATFATV